MSGKVSVIRTAQARLVQALSLANAFPTAMTPVGDVRSLTERLHPRVPIESLIRLGPAGDGGYLVPDDLEGLEACFSPGVSTVSGFELDCAERGMQVFMADKSVDGPAHAHERFHFSKRFVGAVASGDFVTLEGWVNGSVGKGDSELLLQMDIEGYEYEVMLATPEALLRRFRIIIVECHWLSQLWNRPFFRMAKSAFDKLLQHHACVHIHPNNNGGVIKNAGLEIPRTMEFTFVRKDRVTAQYQRQFPHPLDGDNTDKAFVALPNTWYRH